MCSGSTEWKREHVHLTAFLYFVPLFSGLQVAPRIHCCHLRALAAASNGIPRISARSELAAEIQSQTRIRHLMPCEAVESGLMVGQAGQGGQVPASLTVHSHSQAAFCMACRRAETGFGPRCGLCFSLVARNIQLPQNAASTDYRCIATAHHLARQHAKQRIVYSRRRALRILIYERRLLGMEAWFWALEARERKPQSCAMQAQHVNTRKGPCTPSRRCRGGACLRQRQVSTQNAHLSSHNVIRIAAFPRNKHRFQP